MTAPLIHIFTATIKEGQLEGYKKYAQEHAEFAEAKHPRLLAFHIYVNEDSNKVSAVQVHPDADSMEFFMQEVVAQHGVQAYQYLEEGSESSQIYGTPSDAILDGLRQYRVPFSVKTDYVGGFTRLQAANPMEQAPEAR